MGQRIKPEDLREMMRVARKLRAAAQATHDDGYTDLFVRAAIALEERAAQLAYHPSDIEEAEDNQTIADLYRPVDFRC